MRITLWILSALLSFTSLLGQASYSTEKPWTYWWWMGSAVDRENIQSQLISFAEAGLGGVHIIPIYGVKGFEEQFLDFLSEEWMARVNFTLQEAEKLGLGVDLTLGTGWPYGGGWITPEFAARKLVVVEFPLKQSRKIVLDTGQLKTSNDLSDILAIHASSGEEYVDLTPYINKGVVSHRLGNADWEITVYGVQLTGQMVKRAAPGGEGLVMDYFDGKAVKHYLNHFDSVFSNTVYPIHPRAFYHDSYEVYGANWTPGLTDAFYRLQGYDLLPHLRVLKDPRHPDYPLIVHDIRATLAELLYTGFTRTWVDWSTEHGQITRNQAHGSPGNLLDLYGLAGIPETESFGCSDFPIPGLSCDPDYDESRFGRPNPLMMKFASSPAHLLDKPLVSAETGTWLANHFKVSLRRVKPQVDELFVAGINHIFYHGSTYSPKEEGFPGWLFYASTNFGKTSHFRDELPLLNRYIESCQGLLQESRPDNPILLYFPVHDLWTKDTGQILLMLEVHHADHWFSASPFGRTAELLWNKGFCFDYISDKQILQLQTDDQHLATISGISRYQVLIVPPVDFIPEETLTAFEKLCSQGLEIIYVDQLPTRYSGFLASTSGRKPAFEDQKVIASRSLAQELEKRNIRAEELSSKGLNFIRKSNARGKLYFITNLGNTFLEDSLTLATDHRFLSLLDPLSNRHGYIETSGRFSLKIPPGKSYFIQTLNDRPDEARWKASIPLDTLHLEKEWKVHFQGWKELRLKEVYHADRLSSWTGWKDPALESFCGKARYLANFSMIRTDSIDERYILHIDEVHESAQVWINGVNQGTLWAFPNELELAPGSLKKENRIEIVVQNLSANYMKIYDQQNPGWKKFYDINMVDITYNPFKASDWPLEPSGLIGEVYITLEKKQ